MGSRWSTPSTRKPPDVEKFIETVLGTIKAVADGLSVRINALEDRSPSAGERGPAGEPGLPGEKGIDGLPGQDGAPGRDGTDGAIGPIGEKGTDGLRGKDAEPGLPGKDGLDGKDGAAGRDGVDGKDGGPGLHGKDGAVGLEGKVGPPGVPGRDGLPGVQGPHGEKGLDGQHGKDGAVGRDGTLEHLKLVKTGDRTIRLCFKNGDPIEGGDLEFTGLLLDRGVYVAEKAYEAGDVVSWAGSMWIAQQATTDKPGTAAWRLSVKCGREGKPGTNGKDGSAGLNGKDGRDFVHR